MKVFRAPLLAHLPVMAVVDAAAGNIAIRPDLDHAAAVAESTALLPTVPADEASRWVDHAVPSVQVGGMPVNRPTSPLVSESLSERESDAEGGA